MSELLPCPFCGGDADNISHTLHVQCLGCNADMESFTREEAIAAWTRRALPPDVVEVLRILRDGGVLDLPRVRARALLEKYGEAPDAD